MKTTNFEISKQLFEAGFKAEAARYWVIRLLGVTEPELKKDDYDFPVDNRYKAYDLETLLEALPKKIDQETYKGVLLKSDFRLCLSYDLMRIGYIARSGQWLDIDSSIYQLREIESLADTAGRLLLELYKKGIIKN